MSRAGVGAGRPGQQCTISGHDSPKHTQAGGALCAHRPACCSDLVEVHAGRMRHQLSASFYGETLGS
jgi:hypothetical protein